MASFMASCMAILFAMGMTVELERPPAFITHLPLDLTGVMNADPWDADTMAVPDLPLAETPFVFIEGERVFRSNGGETIELSTASGGSALRGLGDADDWAEWAFDIPFDSNEAVLYARMSRPVGEEEDIAQGFRPYTILAVELNNRPGGIMYVNASEEPDAFAEGMAQTELGRVRMGRHLLRLNVRMPGEPVVIDCLWIGARTLDLANELGDDGRMLRPFSISVLAYEPGRLEAGGIPFDLVDPRANEGRGVLLPGDEGVSIPLGAQLGSALLLLGAGSDAHAQGTVTVAYTSGESETTELRWPALYDRNPVIGDEITVSLGLFRRAWVRRVPVRPEPIASVQLASEGGGRLVLLAVTLEYRDES
mgnify:CR=1 FL=1